MMPVVLSSFEFSGLWIYGDALSIAPVSFADLYLISKCPQCVYRGIGEPRFQIKNVRQVLMMKAGRIHSFLNIQSLVSNAQKDIGNSSNNAPSSR